MKLFAALWLTVYLFAWVCDIRLPGPPGFLPALKGQVHLVALAGVGAFLLWMLASVWVWAL